MLDQLGRLTRGHAARTERLWRVLWHCYFDPQAPSQLEIAALLGISDSSVSDYRRKLEAELRGLPLCPEQLPAFSEELDEQLRWRLSLPEGQRALQREAAAFWQEYQPSSLAQLQRATNRTAERAADPAVVF